MKQCKIEINMETHGDMFIKDGDLGTIKKEYIYYRANGGISTDEMLFQKDKIEIVVKRSKKIKGKDTLYTRQSRVYREIVSALIYYYFKFVSMTINNISFNGDMIEEYFQKFQVKNEFVLEDEVLNRLFDYEDDSVYLPLMHILEGLNYENYKLEHTWKAFNFIYNYMTKTTSDRSAYLKVFEEMKSDYELNPDSIFKNIILKSKELVNRIDTGNAIAFMCKNNTQAIKNIGGFEDIFEINEIQDRTLLTKLLRIFNNIFIKNKKDYEENKETRNYKVNGTREYKDVIERFNKRISNNNTEDNDALRFLMNYTFYLRNKSMHGVFQSPAFLFDTDHTSELKKYSDFLAELSMTLLRYMVKNYD